MGEARGKLAVLAGSSFPEPDAAEVTRYLSLLLGLGMDEPPDEPIHPLFAVRRLIEHLGARAAPAVRGPALGARRRAARPDRLPRGARPGPSRRLPCARAARSSSSGARPGAPAWSAILPLDALTPHETASVVSALLAAPDPDVVERVVAAAGATPYSSRSSSRRSRRIRTPRSSPRPSAPRSPRVSTRSRRSRAPRCWNASVIGATFWQRGGGSGRGGHRRGARHALRGLRPGAPPGREPRKATSTSFKHILIRDTAHGRCPADAVASCTPRPRASSRAPRAEARACVFAHHW